MCCGKVRRQGESRTVERVRSPGRTTVFAVLGADGEVEQWFSDTYGAKAAAAAQGKTWAVRTVLLDGSDPLVQLQADARPCTNCTGRVTAASPNATSQSAST